MMSKEIERAWIFKNTDFSYWNRIKKKMHVQEIVQFYTKWNEAGKISKRYRHTREDGKDTYYKTIKRGKGMSREEKEWEVSKDEYERNMKRHIGKLIVKTRYIKKLSDRFKLEFDVFHEPIKDTLKLEIEFPTEKMAKGFDIKKYKFLFKIGDVVEVTDEPEYKNVRIALS